MATAKSPRGYQLDPELANWVRNQRLEYANQQRGKRTRMTQDRIDLLNSMGFMWSTSRKDHGTAGTATTAARSSQAEPATSTEEAGVATEQQEVAESAVHEATLKTEEEEEEADDAEERKKSAAPL